MNLRTDYSLYLVTDKKLMNAPSLCAAVERAVSGGCTVVQLREKGTPVLEFFRLARDVKRVTDRCGVPLIINDRVDIALAVKAAGVHVGQNDLPAKEVRKIIRADMLLGVSVTNADEAIRARDDGADYLGAGAVFSTGTKTDAVCLAEKWVNNTAAINPSVNRLAEIKKAARIPVVAIGGINLDNLGLLKGTGIDGAAVVSAVISAPDIKAAARELKNKLQLFNGRNKL